jgi:hypothetical protein
MLLSAKSEQFHVHILNTVNTECHHLSLPLCVKFPNIQYMPAKRIQSSAAIYSWIKSLLFSSHWWVAFGTSFYFFTWLPSMFANFQQTLRMLKMTSFVLIFFSRKPKQTHWRWNMKVLHSPWEIASFMTFRVSRLFASKLTFDGLLWNWWSGCSRLLHWDRNVSWKC